MLVTMRLSALFTVLCLVHPDPAWATARSSASGTSAAAPGRGEAPLNSTHANASVLACSALEGTFPTKLWVPGQANYTAENQHFWSPTDYASPLCVLTPSSASDVSTAVRILSRLKAKFAVRGGGHMPIPGYANINGGVLIALSDLGQLALANDSSYVSVGPGRRWEEVYAYLQPYGLIALGGRVGLVGVPGLLLGGGISFYSNQYGFAADNVIAYQVVLASGAIVTATASAYADLFWALKGGGNSFGIVTRFDLLTYSSPSICAGIMEYAGDQQQPFLAAVANFGQYGSADTKAAVIPSIFMLGALNTTVYTTALFYDTTANCSQPALSNFTALPAIANSYASTTLAAYVAGTDALIGDGTRQEFRVISSLATAAALQVVHDTFVQMVLDHIWDVDGIQASVAFQPVTSHFIQQGIAHGGNPQAVDVASAPYFWMVENFSWNSAADDAKIHAFALNVTSVIDAQLSAVGAKARYQYMNDAGSGQAIFQNYGAGNLAKLKAIRARYDPAKVYTDLMPGGWKVDLA
ncbi:hypothetical protein BP6252_08872 [Coleophoma cylindrospora]|uniref:FAD-binding PCMH-type domain-containing protein n=1 Tax=Coleophoma cylindrospora TaxID=1849047 RepID=A0A3D8R726_9HELO|nr:hypothetical protein BP6252_08872 [Coleophoma cylindrospora]